MFTSCFSKNYTDIGLPSHKNNEDAFINSALVNTPTVPLTWKGKKQNPESKPGTDHTMGHKRNPEQQEKKSHNAWKYFIQVPPLPWDQCSLLSPRRAWSTAFEKCIIWALGTEQRPHCFLLIPPHKTSGDTAANDSWHSSSALPNVALTFTGQIPTQGKKHTS